VHRRRNGDRDGRGGTLKNSRASIAPLEFQIARDALESIVAQARVAEPAECCGLLVGSGRSIVEAVSTPNIASDPHRFVIDPKAHIEGRRDARRRGLEVLGFYHSHPHAPAVPSATDRAEAAYPGCVYLIVSLATEPFEARLFRFENGDFLETTFGALNA
jgi:proteasome lid subunit RPN8/RPN11